MVKGCGQSSSQHPTPWNVDTAPIYSEGGTGSCTAVLVGAVGTALDSVSACPWLPKGLQIPCGLHAPPETLPSEGREISPNLPQQTGLTAT